VNRRLHAERQTLAQAVEITGIGLHTGEPARLRLHPHWGGLRVRKGASEFPVRWDYVRDTHRAVTLGTSDFALGTVEHLLAALWALGITDCLIEVLQGSEVPILDGSALPFMEMIDAAGGTISILSVDAEVPLEGEPLGEPTATTGMSSPHREGEPSVSQKHPLQRAHTARRSLAPEKEPSSPLAIHHSPFASPVPVLEPVWVQQDDRVVGVVPGNLYAFGYIHFPEPLGEQGGCFDLHQFREQIAPARTFGFLHEVEALRQQGLAQGGSPENALLIAPDGYYNSARFEDEPLRHKILDVIGDLMLCGVNLRDFVLVAVKPGHALDVQLAQAIAQQLPNWQAWMEAHNG